MRLESLELNQGKTENIFISMYYLHGTDCSEHSNSICKSAKEGVVVSDPPHPRSAVEIDAFVNNKKLL